MEVWTTNMSDEMQRDALQVILMAQNMYTVDNDIAKCIAKEFDRKHKPHWTCIIGSFGSYFQGCSLYVGFKIGGNKYIYLLKYN